LTFGLQNQFFFLTFVLHLPFSRDTILRFVFCQGVEVVDNEYFITPDNVGMLKLAKEANTILVR